MWFKAVLGGCRQEQCVKADGTQLPRQEVSDKSLVFIESCDPATPTDKPAEAIKRGRTGQTAKLPSQERDGKAA